MKAWNSNNQWKVILYYVWHVKPNQNSKHLYSGLIFSRKTFLADSHMSPTGPWFFFKYSHCSVKYLDLAPQQCHKLQGTCCHSWQRYRHPRFKCAVCSQMVSSFLSSTGTCQILEGFVGNPKNTIKRNALVLLLSLCLHLQTLMGWITGLL